MSEIDLDAEVKYLKDYWRDRNTQLQADRDQINLTKPVAVANKVQWVSNEPKVFYDTATALVSSYPPRFRLPLTINYDADEKERISKAERLVLGIWRSLDNRQYARGQSYWLREFAYWVLSGWYAVFNAVVEREGQVEFIADCWDAMSVYPEWSSDKLTKCLRTFEVDSITAKAMIYDFVKKGLKGEFYTPVNDRIEVVNFWLQDGKDVYNTIKIGDQTIKKLNKEDFDHIPIHIGAIGNPERGSIEWKKRLGENIIASNRDMYEYSNVILSLMVTIMAETAYPNLVTWTRVGDPAVKAEDVKGFGSVVPLRLEEKIELLKHATTPQEALQSLQYILKQEQKGSIPDVTYGTVISDQSGFAISQLMAAIKYKISPYLNTMQHVISNVMSDFLLQYKKGDFKKIKLSTTNPQEMKKGLFFVEEFNKQDVPDSCFVEVTIPITSALDKTQQILFSRQALQPPQLLSRETLWDEILGVQDSEQEYARILQDETLQMLIVKEIMMIEQLRKREQTMRTNGQIREAEALKRYIMAVEMQLGMRKGIPITPGQEGVSPSGMPPEMGATGGSSPDLVRSALGVGSPGLSRRPQTPEERQNKGIVSSTGQTLIP